METFFAKLVSRMTLRKTELTAVVEI